METLSNLSLTQLGLLLDVFGFAVIFFFGGFSFGLNIVIAEKENPFALPAKLIGFGMVTFGFILQILGAS